MSHCQWQADHTSNDNLNYTNDDMMTLIQSDSIFGPKNAPLCEQILARERQLEREYAIAAANAGWKKAMETEKKLNINEESFK